VQFSHFDLNLLRSLDALLAERNVTRAAERLFVTQQAASGALRRLRDYFEDELLVRVGRHFELTPLAQSLVVPVREALLHVETALATQPSFEPSRARRMVRLAMSDYASLIVLPRLMSLLAKEAPRVTVRVEALTSASFRRLEHGDLDFCITVPHWGLYADYGPSADIQTEALFEDDFVCVVDRRRHPGKAMSYDDYRAAVHNVVRFGNGIETLVELAWRQAGFEAQIAATAPSFSALMFMVPGTPLVATAQRRLARTLASSLRLAVLECPLEMPRLNEHMMWHARNGADPAHAYLRDSLRKVAAKLDFSTTGDCSSERQS
jgi:DNA-binding transcriptional LysR family regulator